MLVVNLAAMRVVVMAATTVDSLADSMAGPLVQLKGGLKVH